VALAFPILPLEFSPLGVCVVWLATKVYLVSEMLTLLVFVTILVVLGACIVLLLLLFHAGATWGFRKIVGLRRLASRMVGPSFLNVAVVSFGMLIPCFASPQNPEIQQRVSDLKDAMQINKQLLAQYTWTEQDIVTLKGDEKKEELYNVRLGPDGKPEKTPVDPSSMSDDDRRKRGLRGRIIEKKTEEYQEYAQSIKALVQQYVPPQKELIEQARQQGNIMAGPTGVPNQVRLLLSNYAKPSNSMTVIFKKAQGGIQSIQINSYLSDPRDAVTVSIQFARLPDGTNHVATETINGVSKQLTISVRNSNYQHM